MPRVRATRSVHFSAAHRLFREEWSDARNHEVFGECSNPNWHGHNYEMDVTVEGEIDPETGFVMNLRTLKETVTRWILDDVDHRNLNLEVPWMEGVNPTTENLVVAIWDRLRPAMPEGVALARIVLRETPRNIVEYTGDGAGSGPGSTTRDASGAEGATGAEDEDKGRTD
jgi:6-pyruvoyltetrahydropterin/6-carboxytetrahydropterin synthase